MAVGLVVTTNHAGTDFDQKVVDQANAQKLQCLEPSVYVYGLTCRPCEGELFRSHLQKRGVCPGCGKVNEEAMAKGWGATRSIHNAACFELAVNRANRPVGPAQ